MCLHSGVVREQSSAVFSESLWRHFQGSRDRTFNLIHHLDLYLKSIPHNPGMFFQLLWYIDNFLNGQVGIIEVDGSF